MNRKYFGTGGVRGRVGQFPITPDFAVKLGLAAGKVLGKKHGKVIIGKDTRLSGYMLEAALESGFSAGGMSPVMLGPMPTPAVAYLTRAFRADLGVVISASHNPFFDNGIKFFSAQGTKLPDEVELEIEKYLDAESIDLANASDFGRAFRQDDAPGRYIEYCKSTFASQFNLSGMTIVLDCANGATYHIAPLVFKELGANVITIGDKPNGTNINDGVGSTHPEALQAKVLATKADLGIAFDGDGDRVLMCDKNGVLRDGDNLLYIIAKDTQKRGRLEGGVVGTLMTNLGLELALKREGIPFARAKVGDRYVMEQLLERKWNLGGENSGHIISLHHATTGDGIVSALQVLKACMYFGKSVEEMSEGLTMFPQDLINVRLTAGLDVTTDDKVQAVVKEVEAELGDTGRVLLRKSGTEPVVRVMVEGEDARDVHTKAQRIADVIIHQSGCENA